MKDKNLQALKSLVQHEQLTTSQQLAHWLQQQRSCEQTLKELLDYRANYGEEYLRQYEVDGQSINIIRNHQLFLEKLNQGIAQQQQQLASIQKDVALIKQQVQQQYQKEQSLETLQTKHRHSLSQQQLYRDQKATDELSSQRYARNNEV